ncbi:MAG: ferredoxin reductase family protein [Erythrobacter sp.]
MTTSSALLPPNRPPPLTFKRMLTCYILIMLIPYAWSTTQGLEYRGIYVTAITILNIAMFAALLAQYPLSGRIDKLTRYTGVDNGMLLHRKAGEIIGLFFLLHPVLIVAPRIFEAPQLVLTDFWASITTGEVSTGVFAWVIMTIWILSSMYRKQLRLSYEAWKISHGVGLVAVAILGTDHAISVGRHGRYDPYFDIMWIVMCAIAVGIVAYTYFWRPIVQKRRPFKLVEAKKVGSSDWSLTIEKGGDFDFDFDAGQFLWLNTSGNPFNRAEHPFSIASSPTALPKISFIIRELGDFTANLHKLKPGQRVFVDGPHGVFTLNGRNATGIALIAGGAGIGPILGILRQLDDLSETRPVRLIYGNRRADQMVFQDTIGLIEKKLTDFQQTLVLEQPDENVEAKSGFISKELLAEQFSEAQRQDWLFYVCGPPVMVDAVADSLREIRVPEQQILFEQLAFD